MQLEIEKTSKEGFVVSHPPAMRLRKDGAPSFGAVGGDLRCWFGFVDSHPSAMKLRKGGNPRIADAVKEGRAFPRGYW